MTRRAPTLLKACFVCSVQQRQAAFSSRNTCRHADHVRACSAHLAFSAALISLASLSAFASLTLERTSMASARSASASSVALLASAAMSTGARSARASVAQSEADGVSPAVSSSIDGTAMAGALLKRPPRPLRGGGGGDADADDALAASACSEPIWFLSAFHSDAASAPISDSKPASSSASARATSASLNMEPSRLAVRRRCSS
eukprot:3609999-Pleurochrysis_carterae.AAC.3